MSKEYLIQLDHGGEAAELILAKPPRFVRFSVYLFAALLITAVLWAYFSKVDIVITAPGAVRPLGNLIQVQSLAAGQVLAVHVKEGEHVNKGDLLLRIDGDALNKDFQRESSRAQSLQKQLSALRAEQQNLLNQQTAEAERDALQISAAQREVSKMQSSQINAEAMLQEVKSRMDIAREDYSRSKNLHAQGIVSLSELQTKESLWKAAEAAHNGALASLHLAEQEVSLAEQRHELQKKQAEVSAKERLGALSNIEQQLLDLEKQHYAAKLEAEKLQAMLHQLAVEAPIDGIVTQLAHKNPGEVVQSGASLAAIAPDNAPWIIEGYVANREAGSLSTKIGASVNIKFDAFPYNDYGTVRGKLIWVSQDAISHKELGMVYRVEIVMESTTLKRGQDEYKIQLGMTVTADIVKEEQRILSLLFREARDRVSY